MGFLRQTLLHSTYIELSMEYSPKPTPTFFSLAAMASAALLLHTPIPGTPPAKHLVLRTPRNPVAHVLGHHSKPRRPVDEVE